MANTPFELVEYHDRKELPFKTGEDIGRGAFATVYEAKKPASEFIYAAKVFYLPNNQTDQNIQKDRIKQEARLISKAQHRHIVSLITTYIFNNKVYIIMEPLADQNLEKYLYGTISNPRAEERQSRQLRLLSWYRCLTSGLAYLHSQFIRHRDIKPQNILIQGDRILLTDFGISKDDPGNTIQTATSTMGTKIYKAPELIKLDTGWVRPGRASDVYSLGAVFLDMLLVHAGLDLTLVCDQKGRHLPYRDHADEWISQLQGSRELCENVYWFSTVLSLCQRMLRQNPGERPDMTKVGLYWSDVGIFAAGWCDCHVTSQT
jgi:serine/threonine protein kinase